MIKMELGCSGRPSKTYKSYNRSSSTDSLGGNHLILRKKMKNGKITRNWTGLYKKGTDCIGSLRKKTILFPKRPYRLYTSDIKG